MTRKKFKNRASKTIAVAMSTMLVMSSSSINVMAASIASDSNATQITETTGDGSLNNPTTTQTTTTVTDSETQQTTTTVDVTISGTGTNADGTEVTLDIAKETVTVTNEEDLVLSETGKETGKETTTATNSSTTTETVDITPENNTTTLTGDTITTTENDGPKTIETITETTAAREIDPENGGPVSITVEEGKTAIKTIETNEDQLREKNLTIPTGSSKTETDETTGIKTTTNVTVEKLTDDQGNVIGYTEVTTITTEAPAVTDTQTGTPAINTTTGETTTDVVTDSVIILPEKPTAGETTDEITGQKTTTTVLELVDSEGNVIGYETTTTVTDTEGKVLSSGSDSVWGVKTTTTTTQTTPTTTETTTDSTITTTTTTVVTETRYTETINVTGTDRVITAEMGNVEAGDVGAGEEVHGSVDTTSIQPDMTLNPATGTVNTTTDLYNRADNNEGTIDVGWDFLFKGEYGLESAIRVKAGTGANDDTWQPHQFVLVDKTTGGEKHYVYCADFEVSPVKGYSYNMENVEDADYYSTEDAQKIVAIALNGYWGVAGNDTGSLNKLKTTLNNARAAAAAQGKDFYLSETQIESLTPGQALTATQAAIWLYGNSGDTLLSASDIVGRTYNGSSFSTTSSADKAIVNGLYQYLIHLDPKSVKNDTTSFIDEDNFAQSAAIEVKELAKGDDGSLLAANADTNENNDVYDTDITFSLSIVPSDVNDDLIVTVFDSNGNVVDKRRLAGNNSSASERRVKANGDGTYTIENIQIAENVDITLNLSGTQGLNKGVYLYSSENTNNLTSQTFVGIADGERNVNLDVDLKFNVSEPTAKIETTSSGYTTQTTNTVTEARTDSATETIVEATIVVKVDEEIVTEASWNNEWTYEAPTEPTTPIVPRTPELPKTPDDPTTPDIPDDPGTLDDTNTPYDPVITENIELPDGSTPLAFLTDNDIPMGVLDASDIPMAMAPATGDTSTLWMILTAISGFLLSGFSFIDKKRKNNQLD